MCHLDRGFFLHRAGDNSESPNSAMGDAHLSQNRDKGSQVPKTTLEILLSATVTEYEIWRSGAQAYILTYRSLQCVDQGVK